MMAIEPTAPTHHSLRRGIADKFPAEPKPREVFPQPVGVVGLLLRLPPGVHPATLDEIDACFGQLSEIRRVQMESVRWMVDLAMQSGVQRIVLNGSFVTDIMEPNDADCVLLVGPGYPADPAAEEELEDGLPFLDIAIVGQTDFDRFVTRIFAADRHGILKGMIEVIL